MSGLRTATAGILAVLWLVAGAPVSQAGEDWGDEFDFLIEREGATVTEGEGDDGNPMRVILVPGDVKIVQRRTPRGFSYTSHDMSGQGAVGCFWMILVSAADTLDRCEELRSPEHAAAIRLDAERIAGFMVAQSHGLYTAEGLDARAAQMRREANACSETAREIAGDFLNKSPDEISRGTDALLAVPRFPALDPCL